MKPLRNQLLLALAILGLLGSGHAEESLPVGGSLGGTTLGGYVDTSGALGAPGVVPEPGMIALAAAGTALLLVAGHRSRPRK
jgi:hypothetical protein